MHLSVIVGAYNMRREIPRTLHTLTPQYQVGVQDLQYDVTLVENGSSAPIPEAEVTGFGPQFRYLYCDFGSPSPVAATNQAVRDSQGDIVCVMNDAARMLSPGVLQYAMAAFRAFPNAVVTTLSWHLGPDVQSKSLQQGYCQTVEDGLLETVPWQEDGYSLHSISALAGSSIGGWFRTPAESNCLFMTRRVFEEIGGMDPRFASPGGGLIALDFFKRAWELETVQPVMLLGEGTFHQYHGGVATNAHPDEMAHKHKIMNDEYRAIRGDAFRVPSRKPIYLGTLPDYAQSALIRSAENLQSST